MAKWNPKSPPPVPGKPRPDATAVARLAFASLAIIAAKRAANREPEITRPVADLIGRGTEPSIAALIDAINAPPKA
jgi:hypothetical protein